MTKRLSKADRRAQLLDVSRGVMREEGAAGLTLGVVAERAGVSRPVVYDHFGTREGLLMALYADLATRQLDIFERAVNGAGGSLASVARVIAVADMQCYTESNLEATVISAALMAYPEQIQFQRQMAEHYAMAYSAALAPHCLVQEPERLRLCHALIGAGASLADLMLHGDLEKDLAVETLSILIVRTLSSDFDPKDGKEVPTEPSSNWHGSGLRK